MAGVAGKHLTVELQTVVHAEAHGIFTEIYVNKHHHQLAAPGKDRAHGRAAHLQPRRAEFSEDKRIVEKHIDKKADAVDGRGDLHLFHGAQAHHIVVGKAVRNIRKRHQRQIAGARLDDRLIFGKDAQDALRHEQADDGDAQRRQEHQLHADAHGLADAPDVALAPVLRNEHAAAG